MFNNSVFICHVQQVYVQCRVQQFRVHKCHVQQCRVHMPCSASLCSYAMFSISVCPTDSISKLGRSLFHRGGGAQRGLTFYQKSVYSHNWFSSQRPTHVFPQTVRATFASWWRVSSHCPTFHACSLLGILIPTLRT